MQNIKSSSCHLIVSKNRTSFRNSYKVPIIRKQREKMADYTVVTSSFLKLHVTTSEQDTSFAEKCFSKDLTVSNLKAKLELITGGNCNTMRVEGYDQHNQYVCSLTENDALLGSYPLDDGMRLHVVDDFSIRDGLNMGDVQKYECSEEEYNKNPDTVKAYLIKNKLGPYSEANIKKKELQLSQEQEVAHQVKVGSRCKVTVTDAPTRLGTVMYTGTVDNLPGYWIGVKFDEPLGKHDGTFQGKRYFECPENYGAFIKPYNVEIGEFLEETYGLDDEM